MPRNGSGVYSPPGASFPAVASTLIESAKYNNVVNDMATAISESLAKDGQTTPTANLPMGGFKITGLGAGTARTDAASLANIQDGTGVYVAAVSGTADAITLTPSPAITAYAAGQTFSFIASGANTGAVTVAVSGLAAKAVTKNGATALAAGDIASGALVVIRYDGTQFQLANVYVNLGTAATQNTGTSGTNVPLLDGANTWAEPQTIESGNPVPLTIRRSDTPAGPRTEAVVLDLEDRATDGSVIDALGRISVDLVGATAGSPTGQLNLVTRFNGDFNPKLSVKGGVFTSGATGGDQGANTINASAYYENGVRMDAQGVAKFWVNFNGSGTVAIRDSFNVTSITDNNVGTYTINFTTALSNANYAVAGFAQDTDTPGDAIVSANNGGAYSTTELLIRIGDTSGTARDCPIITVMGMGD